DWLEDVVDPPPARGKIVEDLHRALVALLLQLPEFADAHPVSPALVRPGQLDRSVPAHDQAAAGTQATEPCDCSAMSACVSSPMSPLTLKSVHLKLPAHQPPPLARTTP